MGAAFALFEMKLVLFRIVSSLEMSLVNSRPIRLTRRGITVAPSDRLRMRVMGSRRNDAKVDG